MKGLYFKGTLACAIAVVVADQSKQCKEFVLSDISTGELFEARQRAKEGEFWSLHELCAKTKLVDDEGNHHNLSYEALRSTSSANYKKLEEAELKLAEKLEAESLGTQSA